MRRLLKGLPTGDEKLETAVNKVEGGGSGFAMNLDSKEWEYVDGTEAEEDSVADDLNQKFSGKNSEPKKLEESKKSSEEKSEKPKKTIPLVVNGASNVSLLEDAKNQLDAKKDKADELIHTYMSNQNSWSAKLGPNDMAELDEHYATICENLELQGA